MGGASKDVKALGACQEKPASLAGLSPCQKARMARQVLITDEAGAGN
jgi:hypothetical protein